MPASLAAAMVKAIMDDGGVVLDIFLGKGIGIAVYSQGVLGKIVGAQAKEICLLRNS